MTTGEILVIAAAAAVFIIINIIMWSIIAKKERKAIGSGASRSKMTSVPLSEVSAAAAAAAPHRRGADDPDGPDWRDCTAR